ncbi:MAG: hypothetical protein SRB1_02933 [Desulfobacteraceae bacterium Eth-SRB1]|nr:MAG: hypothetical protein SRB1_02933 [Desulfobacteraceae bacterium Eth-SRB1]
MFFDNRIYYTSRKAVSQKTENKLLKFNKLDRNSRPPCGGVD